ncbi:OmpA family protein [Brucepastera parasyntrophica]|uniref:OmpA family protein n=1 Tax=Brucepastera parasyntrophica TaxID=2880008 RepID=UPI00210E879C|nr:OmpA family protein [Brucepastera parasyntrophica]ULQ60199.1 OmpA family protein [Brucepastera parasyntrophica]
MKPLFFLFGCCFLISAVFPQSTDIPEVSLSYSFNGNYTLVERSNWSKYQNGKYIGLTHNETRARVKATGENPKGQEFSGFFYVLEETLRDMAKTSRSIDEINETAFTVLPDGTMQFSADSGYPRLRGFPVFPDTRIKPGDRWQAEGVRIIDPKRDGKTSALPILVEYTFSGKEEYRNIPVYRIKARYATRINKYNKNRSDDPDLVNATGTHEADILVNAENGSIVLILDRLDETFYYADGTNIRYKGNTAMFTEIPVPVQKEILVKELETITSDAAKKHESGGSGSNRGNLSGQIQNKLNGKTPDADSPFSVEETAQGIRLSMKNIHFQADTAVILDDETWRLDAIAEALRLAPKNQYLVEGHTASTGDPAAEKRLSEERAKKIIDELVKRGLHAEQFMYTGYGGTRPAAGNNTEEGRAQNRRVEITILE